MALEGADGCGLTNAMTAATIDAVIEAPPQGQMPVRHVLEAHTAWQHLQSRDCWSRPRGARDDQAFLMVVAMETWFLADRELLKMYFGRELVESHFKRWPALEDVSKETVLNALRAATARCSSPYKKGKVSFDLLAKLNPSRVETECPHAKELLDRLRGLS